MSTLATWVGRVRGHLLSGHQEQRNTLSAGYTAGSGTLTFTGVMNGIVATTRLSISTNTFFVTSVSGQTATVTAGEAGSVDANALTGALVRVNPMVTDHEIVSALGDELLDLSTPDNGLYQMLAANIASATAYGYDLTGFPGIVTANDLIDIYEVRPQDFRDTTYFSQMDKIQWRLDRNANTADFPSGISLQLYGIPFLGTVLRVLYKAGFTVPTALTDDLSTTGLAPTAWDIPPLGAAMRIMVPREIKRNRTETQSDTRRAQEVAAGAVANSYRGLAQLRQARVMAEAGRLLSQYPNRRW